MHIVCKKKKVKMVEILLKNGATLEAATETGLTPLHVASFVGCPEAVVLLLQRGANVNGLTVRSESSLHLAIRNRQLETAKVLIKHGALVDAAARSHEKVDARL
ncbi:unnamed protein product [Protopolystoma xenopodis]|uniref:Uncharacterized protein n=1 Tax=Protopolystoma xenopodis TaxID=117903 RepID=A0A3S5ADY9_9PLAT|nr:unnamed protein product [Protopolystoma xenopodis]